MVKDYRELTKYVIYREKYGVREDYKTVRGKKTVKEEVKRLNHIDDGVSYGYRKFNQPKPKNKQANRMF